ncbi:MAG: hypothetical protein HQ504_10095 [Rhodospirillaceae bacterium]|nr:hypothetical protein [Rhodospirillaceae bacterium]
MVKSEAKCRVKSVLGDLLSDRSGVIIVLFALMLPIMIGFLGLGIEVSYWFQNRRNLQIAADSAAVGGAFELLDGGTSTTATAIATTEAGRNGYDATTDTITVNIPPSTGSYTTDSNAVEVIMTSQLSLMFADYFLGDSITVNTRAVATSAGSGDEACVLALDSSASKSVNVSGTADVEMDGCHVASNSSASNAINVQGAATLEVDCVSTVGSVSGTVTMDVCATAEENIAAISDPFDGLSVPTYSSCDETSYSPPSSSVTITPPSGIGGTMVFCSGLSINASDTVVFDPGVYIIDGGSFRINGGATVSGTDVTFIFTGSGSDWASVSINGSGDVDFTAPDASALTADPWSGILMFQDPAATNSASNDFTFNGNSTTELTGVIYVPNNDISFSGGNELDDAGCLMLVALEISFNGNADLDNNCDAAGVTPIYTSYTTKLVE